MKKTLLLSFFLLFNSLLIGQTIKIQTGISISKLDWQTNGEPNNFMDKDIIGHNFFLGVDYCQKKYFGLSSNFGLIRKGAEDIETFTYYSLGQFRNEETYVKTTLDYISLNTQMEFHYLIKEIYFPFISIGPRIDFIYRYDDNLYFLKQDLFTKIAYGFDFGAGLKIRYQRLVFGIRYDYLFNLNNLFYTDKNYINQKEIVDDKTKLISLTLGYSLNKK